METTAASPESATGAHAGGRLRLLVDVKLQRRPLTEPVHGGVVIHAPGGVVGSRGGMVIHPGSRIAGPKGTSGALEDGLAG